MEEAKLLDKREEHSACAAKYGLATEIFGELTAVAESEQDRGGLQLIHTLSRAWQTMARAEAETSPSLYGEASRLFEEAKGLGPNEKSKQLALGHSRFCRALQAGMEFADGGDEALHGEALQHLEGAARFYLRAGFQTAAEYAKATRLLLDAYLYSGRAGRESDHDTRAKLYAVAEKLLETSSAAYAMADHPGRKEQVGRLLQKVREERAMAISLGEVLRAPAVVSTTEAFSTPQPSYEKAVGLERFAHADIQANLTSQRKELRVNESLEVEIELVNAGGGPAQLIKVEDLIPRGFELLSAPEAYRVEGNYLDMRGRRLDPLKTEEVKLLLKPTIGGQFVIGARILYLDESGKYKSHEPEPIEVAVSG